MKNRLAVSFAALLTSVLFAQAPATGKPIDSAPVASTPTPAAASDISSLLAPSAKTRLGNFVLDAGDHRTSDLVDKVAQYLGRNILFCEVETSQCGPAGGNVKLQQRVEVDAAGAEELLCHLLYVRGLALVVIDESKGMYEVISMAGQRGREVSMRATVRTLDEVLARPNLRMMVTTSLVLKNINANIATNAMRPFFAMSGNPSGATLTLGTAGSENGLLISGFQDQVASFVRMVQNLDANAAKQKETESFKLAELEQRIAVLEAKLGGEKK